MTTTPSPKRMEKMPDERELETPLINRVIRALYPWVHLMRCNAGTVETKDGHKFHGLPAGHPDLYGTMPKWIAGTPSAVPVYIELKREGEDLSEKQREFLNREWKKGSVVGVAHSEEEAWRIIEPYVLPYYKGEEWMRYVESKRDVDSRSPVTGRESDSG